MIVGTIRDLWAVILHMNHVQLHVWPVWHHTALCELHLLHDKHTVSIVGADVTEKSRWTGFYVKKGSDHCVIIAVKLNLFFIIYFLKLHLSIKQWRRSWFPRAQCPHTPWCPPTAASWSESAENCCKLLCNPAETSVSAGWNINLHWTVRAKRAVFTLMSWVMKTKGNEADQHFLSADSSLNVYLQPRVFWLRLTDRWQPAAGRWRAAINCQLLCLKVAVKYKLTNHKPGASPMGGVQDVKPFSFPAEKLSTESH